MFFSPLRSGPKLRVLASLLALTAVGAASAQEFYYRDMVDLDQRRYGLPNSGEMYCVPTSYANLLVYMGQAGVPGLVGLGQTFDTQTSLISNLGLRMGTDPEDGTDLLDSVEGMVEYLADYSNLYFVHIVLGPTHAWGIEKFKELTDAGAILKIGYGRYEENGFGWTRDGGHAVTVAGYDYQFDVKQLLIANPWTDDDDQKGYQSEFYRGYEDVTNVFVNTTDYGYTTHARLGPKPASGGKLKLIDSLHAILPGWASWMDTETLVAESTDTLWASLTGGVFGPTRTRTVLRTRIPQPYERGRGSFREIDIALPGPVRDWSLDPSGLVAYALGEDDTIMKIDMNAGTVATVGSVLGAKKLAVAGKSTMVFVLQEGARTDNIVRLDPKTGRQSSKTVAKGITQLRPDPDTFGVAALHPGQSRVYRVSPDLTSIRPQIVELPAGVGSVHVGIDRLGKASFVRSGSPTLVLARPGSNSIKTSLRRAMAVRSFSPMGKNRYIVQEGDLLTTIAADGSVVPGPFDGLRATGAVQIAQGWNTILPQDVSGPGWRNIRPDSF